MVQIPLTISVVDSNSGSDVNGNSVSSYRWETPDKHVIKIHISLSIEEAVNMFKKSVATLKTYIYSLKAQNRTYNEIKESVDHGEILVHVDYAELCKNS